MSRRLALVAIAALAIALAGCGGKKPGGVVAVTSTTIDGQRVAKLGFGGEGGEKPALLRRADGGYALAYAGTRQGQRKIYFTSSPDGERWAPPEAVAAGELSDQAPALAEDQAGRLHLFFASNRGGEAPELYHAEAVGEAFGAPTPIAGFEGAQDLAVAAGPQGLTLVAEVMGAGLLAAESADGATWSAPSEVVPAGAEPALAALPDGRCLVAYQLEGKIWLSPGRAGAWEPATEAASGNGRLRDPGLAWAGAQGLLVYSEKGESGLALRARSLDATFSPAAAQAPSAGPGDHRGVAISLGPDGSKAFAWGMKTPNGQQGVMVSVR